MRGQLVPQEYPGSHGVWTSPSALRSSLLLPGSSRVLWTPIITPQPEENLQGGHAQVQPHTVIPHPFGTQESQTPLHQQDRPHSQTQTLFVGHHSSWRSQPGHSSTQYLSSAPGGAHVGQQDGRMQGEGQPLTRPSRTHPGPAKSPQLGFSCPKHQT